MTAYIPKSAVALGFFDGIHKGHAAVIDLAVKSGNMPAVFTFKVDRHSPASKSGHKSLLSENLKTKRLSSLGVKKILSPDFDEFSSLSPFDYVENILHKSLNADTVCCGEDFRFGKNAAGDCGILKDLCSALNIKVLICPPIYLGDERISSSKIRAYIEGGDLKTANDMLGYCFCFDFPVVDGYKLGRKLHFPTINQQFPSNYTIPKYGVYASYAVVSGDIYPSITNVGIKPTVAEKINPLAETYIIGYSGDLYGENIKVSLIEFMREEIRFTSIDELKSQISSDLLNRNKIVVDRLTS